MARSFPPPAPVGVSLIGVPTDIGAGHRGPSVGPVGLRNARTEDVAHYLTGRGNFYTAPFTVNRFVLMSSKESVGGGPYVTEEVFPLYESGGSWDGAELHDHLV